MKFSINKSVNAVSQSTDLNSLEDDTKSTCVFTKEKRNIKNGACKIINLICSNKKAHELCFVLCIICSVCICFFSCSKLVEVNPPITSTNGENVFDEDGSAIAVLTGVYANMSKSDINTGRGWLTNICFTTGLTGDEFDLWNSTNNYYSQYYNNNITTIEDTWYYMYRAIFIANSALEQLPSKTKLTPAVRNQLVGEAKFIRALNFFYLANLYGDVPLTLTSDYKTNETLPRSTVSNVYQQIIGDLEDAKLLLSGSFIGNDCITPTNERIRPTKWAAIALLARTYLYTGRFLDAEAEATSIINNKSLFQMTPLNDVFLMNSGEAIWQLQPVGTTAEKIANTRDGQLFVLPSLPSIYDYSVYLKDTLVNSFSATDQRKEQWINSIEVNSTTYYYPFKYKIGLEEKPTTEYSMVLRLAEQYLIRAEARAMQEKLTGNNSAASDINVIRQRAGIGGTPAFTKDEILQEIQFQRKLELFTEWGHRWLDLKRTDQIDQVLKNIKPNWAQTDKLFPIPINIVTKNPNVHQNNGY